MAKKCGWDKDYIAERFTFDQVRLYVEYLLKMEQEDIKRMAIAFRAAQTSTDDFQKFLDDGQGDKVETQADFKKMKDEGLPVEEQ